MAAPDVSVADEEWSFEPELDVRRYTDLYGNPCLRTVLPAGELRPAVCGARDGSRRGRRRRPGRRRGPGGRPPGRRPAVHPAEPVLPARHAGQRGLEAVRRRPARLLPRPGDLRPRPRAPDLPVRLEHGDVDGARRLHERVRGLPRLHAPGHLVLPGAEHPGPVRVRLPPGHGRAAGPRADGLRGVDGGLARRPLVDLRPAQQPAAQGPGRHRTGPRRVGRRHGHDLRRPDARVDDRRRGGGPG